MSLRLSTAFAFLLGAASAFADNAAAPTPAPQFPGYHLTNRSTYDAPAGSRIPFWPIGWSHKSVLTQVTVASAIDPQMFVVTSILLANPPPLAVINGRSYAVGEYVKNSKPKGSDAPKLALPANARVRVVKIEDGKVTLGTEKQTLTVPLQRPDFQDQKTDKETDAEKALEEDSISK